MSTDNMQYVICMYKSTVYYAVTGYSGDEQ